MLKLVLFRNEAEGMAWIYLWGCFLGQKYLVSGGESFRDCSGE